MDARAAHRRLLVVLVLVAFLFIYPRPFFPRLPSANELSRVYLVVAIAERGSFVVDREVERWGEHEDLSLYEGHWYSNKPPGGALTALPAYLAGSAVAALAGTPLTIDDILVLCTLSAATLPTLLLLWYLGRRWLGDGLETELTVALVFLLACGTLLFPYATMFFSHNITAAALAGALLLMTGRGAATDHGAPARWPFVVAGFLAGWAGLCEYQVIPIAGLLALGAVFCGPAAHGRNLRGIRNLGFFAAGAAPPAAFLLAYNQVCFGSPFSLSSFHEGAAVYAALGNVGVAGVTLPGAVSLYGLILSPARGLLFWSPFLALAAVAWIGAIRAFRPDASRRAAILSATVAAGLLLIIAAYRNWDGGAAVGPRYLGASIPAYGMAIAMTLRGHSQRLWLRLALVVLGSIAVANFALAVGTYTHLPASRSDIHYNPIGHLCWPLAWQGFTLNNWGYHFGMTREASFFPFLAVLVAAWCLAVPPVLAAVKRPFLTWLVAATLILVSYPAWLTVGIEASPRRAVLHKVIFYIAAAPRR